MYQVYSLNKLCDVWYFGNQIWSFWFFGLYDSEKENICYMVLFFISKIDIIMWQRAQSKSGNNTLQQLQKSFRGRNYYS